MTDPSSMVTHRFTRNSRGPGQDGVAVSIRVTAYEECVNCGGKKPSGDGAHAPHFRPGVGLVDCAGNVLRGLHV